ncbi:alpha/beta fold hydrolase [Nonomuraea rubra]|uniref:Pimeloyl-ACP methyl ester carboxylesterase n=1 Tax=Nonomuraea rubra TaxID=46180 RepID=A0A7X0U293_9ACTN|nr:alpha/beta hydrolase [Nonomuraea rubra]MBB6552254.1 pimeloyl-ACP methyl ester carboxylesterase [Nonomuraea rubra]
MTVSMPGRPREATGPRRAARRDRLQPPGTSESVYWFTQTAGSSAHTYFERINDFSMWGPVERGSVPTAVAVFATDFSVRPPAERVHNVVRRSELGHGGHFAALETPEVLVTELREFFGSLR